MKIGLSIEPNHRITMAPSGTPTPTPPGTPNAPGCKMLASSLDKLTAKLDEVVAAMAAAGPATEGGSAAATSKVTKRQKRARVRSAYNTFMSEELARLKNESPELGHRERFASAVRQWQAKHHASSGAEPEETSPSAA